MSQTFDEAVAKFLRALDAEQNRLSDMEGDTKAAETRLRALKATDAELTDSVRKAMDELVEAREGVVNAKREAGEAATEIHHRATAAAEKMLADAQQRAEKINGDARQVLAALAEQRSRAEHAVELRKAEHADLVARIDTAKGQLADMKHAAAAFARD
jgi:cell division septum initiation protein DivIVA